jgi:hypothetical protein
MKTSELTGAALDWAVAKCERLKGDVIGAVKAGELSPSTQWHYGGPIIEREKITLQPVVRPDGWTARTQKCDSIWEGPTPLIAAMRCYVASKLGDEVEVPDELH